VPRLATAFVPHLVNPDAFRDRQQDLEDALASLVERGRAAWPSLQVEPSAFVRHIAERLPEADPAGALAAVHAEDLYLACALCEGQRRALSCFEDLLSQVPSYLGRAATASGLAEEVKQAIREKLFVASDGKRSRIHDYTGRGPLGGWLRVTAVRAALNLRRGREQHVAFDEAAAGSSAPDPDPELAYLKKRYGEEFRHAFHVTLAALDVKQRNILRMYFLEGLPAHVIGRLYQVHETTVLRWLARAREEILSRTHRALCDQLQVADSEFDSILRLVQSQLDQSLYRFFEDP
jgi:RNA polymerase sigma-70 factor (ECF subfamily)